MDTWLDAATLLNPVVIAQRRRAKHERAKPKDDVMSANIITGEIQCLVGIKPDPRIYFRRSINETSYCRPSTGSCDVGL